MAEDAKPPKHRKPVADSEATRSGWASLATLPGRVPQFTPRPEPRSETAPPDQPQGDSLPAAG